MLEYTFNRLANTKRLQIQKFKVDKLNLIDGVILSPLKIIENPLGNVFME